jgi:hypothetical protein
MGDVNTKLEENILSVAKGFDLTEAKERIQTSLDYA